MPVYAIVAAAYTRYQPHTFALAFFAVGPSFIGFVFSSVVIRLEAAICSSYLLWALSYLLVVMVALLAKRSVGFALPRDPLVLFLQLWLFIAIFNWYILPPLILYRLFCQAIPLHLWYFSASSSFPSPQSYSILDVSWVCIAFLPIAAKREDYCCRHSCLSKYWESLESKCKGLVMKGYCNYSPGKRRSVWVHNFLFMHFFGFGFFSNEKNQTNYFIFAPFFSFDTCD